MLYIVLQLWRECCPGLQNQKKKSFDFFKGSKTCQLIATSASKNGMQKMSLCACSVLVAELTITSKLVQKTTCFDQSEIVNRDTDKTIYDF